MNLLASILGDIIVYEIDVSNGTISTKISTSRYSLKNSKIMLKEIDSENFDWSKRKDSVAVLHISGNDVGSKEYDVVAGDDAVTKITENENILWTVYEEDNYAKIDFIRKSSLDSLLKEIGDKGFYIADTTVSQQGSIDIYMALQELYEKKEVLDFIIRSKELRAFFFDSLFNKIKLPLLLFFFALLFVNYVLFSNIKEKYEISETTYNIQLSKNKLETENSEKANRLFNEYNNIQGYPLALISDRIGAYLPKNVRLTSMEFFPERKAGAKGKSGIDTSNVIVVKGKAEIAGTVLLLAQYLQEDKLFNKVDIININDLKDTGSYDFEIQIIL